MELPQIKTESDYQNALTKIERLFDVEPLSLLLDHRACFVRSESGK